MGETKLEIGPKKKENTFMNSGSLSIKVIHPPPPGGEGIYHNIIAINHEVSENMKSNILIIKLHKNLIKRIPA